MTRPPFWERSIDNPEVQRMMNDGFARQEQVRARQERAQDWWREQSGNLVPETGGFQSDLDRSIEQLTRRPMPDAPRWPVADHPCVADDVGPYEPCEACGALISVQRFQPTQGLDLRERVDRYEFVRRECFPNLNLHELVYAPHTPERCQEVRRGRE